MFQEGLQLYTVYIYITSTMVHSTLFIGLVRVFVFSRFPPAEHPRDEADGDQCHVSPKEGRRGVHGCPLR